MSVVLRCPNCGTSRPTPGECEACHEAQVRYFCNNHTPGLWLSARTCPSCGAGFGAPAPVRKSPPAPVLPRAPALRAPATSSAPPVSYSRTDPTEAAPGVVGRRERSPSVREDVLEPSSPAMAPWQRILQVALRARFTPSVVEPGREPAPRLARSASGCLRRLVLLVVFLVVALVIALFLFGRALMHGLQPY